MVRLRLGPHRHPAQPSPETARPYPPRHHSGVRLRHLRLRPGFCTTDGDNEASTVRAGHLGQGSDVRHMLRASSGTQKSKIVLGEIGS